MVQIDMEMPKVCGECRFRADGWCYAIEADDKQPSKIDPSIRMWWCPLQDVNGHENIFESQWAIENGYA
jgi:hypothetical protein